MKKRPAAPARRAPEGTVLAMDIGTSSLRTALFSTAGQRLEETTSQQTYSLHTDTDGAAELPAAALLKAGLRALEETLLHREKDRGLRAAPVLGWGVSCFWHSLSGADERFAPITPIYTWGDSRCAPDAARLREKFPERAVHARTGCMLRASYWPAKLDWLRRTQKALFHRAVHWLSPADLLCAKLCGQPQASFSMASGTGLLDLRRGQWDGPLLRHLRFRLPPFCPSDPLQLSERFVRRFPALRGVPIFPAIGDGAAGNLGSGAIGAGVAALNYGTSAAMRVVRVGDYAPPPFGLFCYAISPGRWLVGGATSNAGNAHRWASEMFQGSDAELESHSRRLPQPDPSLTALAFLNGERAPTWCEDLPGAIFGLRLGHTALDLRRAFADATFLRLAQIVEPLEQAVKAKRLRFIVSGGLSHSRAAVGRLANILGRTCQISDEREASLRGAAVHALKHLGRRLPAARKSTAIRPDPKLAKLHAKTRARQEMLEEAMRVLSARWAEKAP